MTFGPGSSGPQRLQPVVPRTRPAAGPTAKKPGTPSRVDCGRTTYNKPRPVTSPCGSTQLPSLSSATKPMRVIDLYDTCEMIHRSKTGTELAVGYHKLTGETVVIKAMDASKFPKKQLQLSLEKYSRLHHPHICQLYESFDSLRVILVLEPVDGLTLTEFMIQVGVSADEARQIMRQACLAIRYAHRAGVCHRDLRLENIMLQQGPVCCVKIVDWASAGPVGRPLSRRIEPSPYCPPEALGNVEYEGRLLDVWALGVALHVLLVGTLPFEGGASELQLDASGGAAVVPAQAAALLRGMLAIDPEMRLTIEQVCASPWLDAADDDVPRPVPPPLADEPHLASSAAAAAAAAAATPLDADVVAELVTLGMRAEEVEASVRHQLHDTCNTAYRLLLAKKRRALEALPADTAAPASPHHHHHHGAPPSQHSPIAEEGSGEWREPADAWREPTAAAVDEMPAELERMAVAKPSADELARWLGDEQAK